MAEKKITVVVKKFPDIKFISVSLNRTEAAPGEEVKATIRVENTGVIDASPDVWAFLDGTALPQKWMYEIEPGVYADYDYVFTIPLNMPDGDKDFTIQVGKIGVAVTDWRKLSFTVTTPPPVIITPSELHWTDGTYRAAFAITNLDPTSKYKIEVYGGGGHVFGTWSLVMDMASIDISYNIAKADIDTYGDALGCRVYNRDTGVWVADEEYTVPPYEIKGFVDLSGSSIPTTIYLEESADFNMMVYNVGDIEREYAVHLAFKNVDTGKEFPFSPAHTIYVPSHRTALNTVSVVMPSAAIPIEKDSQTFDLLYRLICFI